MCKTQFIRILRAALCLMFLVLSSKAYAQNSCVSIYQKKFTDHSYQQVAQMLKDRPNMAFYYKPSGEKVFLELDGLIYQLALEKFSSPDMFFYWSSAAVASGANADHTYPRKGRPGRIKISATYNVDGPRGKPMTFEELWSSFFFEVFNMQSAAKFEESYQRAINDHTYTKEQFIRDNTQAEHTAILKLKKLYKEKIEPWQKRNGLVLNGKYWNEDFPDKYEDWIASYTDLKSYPFDSWGKYFDEAIIPYRNEMKKFIGK